MRFAISQKLVVRKRYRSDNETHSIVFSSAFWLVADRISINERINKKNLTNKENNSIYMIYTLSTKSISKKHRS